MSKYGMALGALPFLLLVNSSYSFNPFKWFQSKETIRGLEKLEKAQADLEETIRKVAVHYGQEFQVLGSCPMPLQVDKAELCKVLENVQTQVMEQVISKKSTITEGLRFGAEAVQFPCLAYFEKLFSDLKSLKKAREYYKKWAEKNKKDLNTNLVDNTDILVENLTFLRKLVFNSQAFIDEFQRYSAQYEGPVHQRSNVEVEEVCPDTDISVSIS